MMKKSTAWLLVLLLCLGAVIPASAGNTFLLTEKSISLFEGEVYQSSIVREGIYGGDAEIRYSSSKKSVATVTEDGTVTAVGKGETTITAALLRKGKQVGKAQMTVRVLRAVTKVTLNTTKLSVYDPEDPAIFSLLREEAEQYRLVLEMLEK